MRLTTLALSLAFMAPLPLCSADDKPARQGEPTVADDTARLLGKWKFEKAVWVKGEKEPITFTIEFKADGTGWFVTSDGSINNFVYAVIDLKGTGRVLVLVGAAFPNGNVIPYGWLGKEKEKSKLVFTCGEESLHKAELNGEWNRVPAKGK